jgi:hypothetical protein
MGHVTIAHGQWQLVDADVRKLQSDRTPAYAGAAAFVVAIVWSNESIEAMEAGCPPPT